MSQSLEELDSRYQSWLKGASSQHGLHTEIKDIEKLLLTTEMFITEKALKVEKDDVIEAKKRLIYLGQTSPSVDHEAMKKLYEVSRGLKRAKAYKVAKNYEYLNTLLKEVYCFCIETAMLQLLKMTAVLKEDTLTSPKETLKCGETDLINQKRENHDVAVLQSMVAKQNLDYVRKAFHDSKLVKLQGETSQKSNDFTKSNEVKEYVDSCIELCWFMMTSVPIMCFVWGDDDKLLFKEDTSGEHTGELKVVYPALVKIRNGVDQYEVILKGLKQRTEVDTESPNVNKQNTTADKPKNDKAARANDNAITKKKRGDTQQTNIVNTAASSENSVIIALPSGDAQQQNSSKMGITKDDQKDTSATTQNQTSAKKALDF